MFNAANCTPGVGIVLFLAGSGYWLWFASPTGRIAKFRSHRPWNLLGNLTVAGLLLFLVGRMLGSR